MKGGGPCYLWVRFSVRPPFKHSFHLRPLFHPRILFQGRVRRVFYLLTYVQMKIYALLRSSALFTKLEEDLRQGRCILLRSLDTLYGSSMSPSIVGHFSPNIHLALEEFFLTLFPRSVKGLAHSGKNAQKGTIFFLYRNKTPCVVIGRNQVSWLETALSHPDERRGEGYAMNIEAPFASQYFSSSVSEKATLLIRRVSGGGCVYHDLGCLCFCIVTSRGGYDPQRNLVMVQKATKTVLHRWIKTFKGNQNIALTESSRGDLFFNKAKITGSAMRITDGASLHHGTLLIHSSLPSLRSVLRPTLGVNAFCRVESKGPPSILSTVTSLYEILQARGRKSGVLPFLQPETLFREVVEALQNEFVREYASTRKSSGSLQTIPLYDLYATSCKGQTGHTLAYTSRPYGHSTQVRTRDHTYARPLERFRTFPPPVLHRSIALMKWSWIRGAGAPFTIHLQENTGPRKTIFERRMFPLRPYGIRKISLTVRNGRITDAMIHPGPGASEVRSLAIYEPREKMENICRLTSSALCGLPFTAQALRNECVARLAIASGFAHLRLVFRSKRMISFPLHRCCGSFFARQRTCSSLQRSPEPVLSLVSSPILFGGHDKHKVGRFYPIGRVLNLLTDLCGF